MIARSVIGRSVFSRIWDAKRAPYSAWAWRLIASSHIMHETGDLHQLDIVI